MDTKLRFWEIAPGGWAVAQQAEYTMSGYGFLHDFGITENYYVLVQASVRRQTHARADTHAAHGLAAGLKLAGL